MTASLIPTSSSLQLMQVNEIGLYCSASSSSSYSSSSSSCSVNSENSTSIQLRSSAHDLALNDSENSAIRF